MSHAGLSAPSSLCLSSHRVQAKLKVTGISVALRVLLTDKVCTMVTLPTIITIIVVVVMVASTSATTITSANARNPLTIFPATQSDVRLERNDIIAMVNTLQQVLASFCLASWDGFVSSPS